MGLGHVTGGWNYTVGEHHIYGSSRIGVHQTNTLMRTRYASGDISITLDNDPEYTQMYRGKRHYELSNHLGNVQVVISDKRISVCDEYLAVERFEAEVLSAVDYYPFGMMMPDRQWYADSDSGSYNFGFGGQLKDDEVSGIGNSYSAEYWEYDPRLGRRWNADPLSKVWESPYLCFHNSPFYFNDPSGLSGEPPVGGNPQNGDMSEDGEYVYGLDGTTGEYRWCPIGQEAIVRSESDPLAKNKLNTPSDNTSYYLPLTPNRSFPSKDLQIVQLVAAELDLSQALFDGLVNVGDNGKLYTKRFHGNQYVKIVPNPLKPLGYLDLAFDVIVVADDFVDVFSAVSKGSDDIMGKVGVLVIDFSGAAIGYYSPLTGGFIAFYQSIVQTDEFARIMYNQAIQQKCKIMDEWEKELPGDIGFQYTIEWRYWDRVKDQYDPDYWKPKELPTIK